MHAATVRDQSQVSEARRAAVTLAASLGFGESDKGRVAIVATELATNLLKHGGGGELLLGAADDGQGAGVECLALDKGPGISDVAAALRDGHSTAGTPGNGLGAVSRMAQVLDIYSRPGAGAAILARVYPKSVSGPASFAQPATGAVIVAMPGEEACGDAWSVRRERDGLVLMVVDGLGHGPLAATAAHQAVKVYEAAPDRLLPDVINRIHLALKATRGAAASIAWLPRAPDAVTFIGVGNVAGVLISGGETRRMVSYNGTLGHALRTARPFTYPASGEAVVVLASDGLRTGWSLDAYPGLKQRHPSLIAGVLYRDYYRGRDDVTVLVAKRLAA